MVLCSTSFAPSVRSLDRPVSKIPIVLYGVFTLHMSQFMHLIIRNINVLIKSCHFREPPKRQVHELAEEEGSVTHLLTVISLQRQTLQRNVFEKDVT